MSVRRLFMLKTGRVDTSPKRKRGDVPSLTLRACVRPSRVKYMLLGLLLVSGCLYHAKEETDLAVSALAAHPFDLQLPEARQPSMPALSAGKGTDLPAALPAAKGR